MLGTDTSRPGNLLARLGAWWRGRRRSQTLTELEHCNTEFIAQDVGLSLGELRVIAARRPDAAELLRPRLAAIGIDLQRLVRASPEVLRDLERVCALCRSKRRCAHDLADAPEDPKWRDYCPNVTTLDALQGETESDNTAADAPYSALHHGLPGQA